MKEYIARIKKSDDAEQWEAAHELSDHLQKTSKRAGELASSIGSEWALLAGRWHDLGKYREKFQDYIRIQTGYESENTHIENGTRQPHSTAGAIHAVNTLPAGFGHIIAYLIAGHHAGLADWNGGRGSLKYRLENGVEEYNEALAESIPVELLSADTPTLPEMALSADAMSLWIRMLFSCLVDADFLDTESYMQPDKSLYRQERLSLNELQTRFYASMSSLQQKSSKSSLSGIRNKILNQCESAAALPPGIFSLTVPTGGGKTLSSLAFALKHAARYDKKRIIYAIPFTSIIEQNADVFRSFLGKEAVLEHHSNLDVAPEKESSASRLAAENWDAPLIVTTNVQLFESLHASRTSRCRKLHNITNSVIILDEAQQIPRDFHAPITQVMRQLSEHYGVTWVLCTATQPVLTESKSPFGQVMLKGLGHVHEIISNPAELAVKLKRVEVQLPKPNSGRMSWSSLADELAKEPSVLVIVNTRRQARKLFELLPDSKNNLHLSANMCAQHRTELIAQIKIRLQQRRDGDTRPLRVVSTQLIEAGVDVDFPLVYRAMAGLDSIAQSAGRCNREDKLKSGRVVVFNAEEASPAGFLRQGEEITIEMIANGQLEDPLSPESFYHYFSMMNSKGERDKYNIVDLLTMKSSADAPLAIQFREAAEQFRLIDDKGVAVIVPFEPEGCDDSPIEEWISQLERDASQKWVYKKLQRYTVTIPERLAVQYQANKCIDERAGLYVLLDDFYHECWGVDSAETLASAEASVM
ncbi:MAG: CRISPR-associated helicase Cas3' [Candidatus Polarisedimenticolaceae bacterium]|nr:CRISPR-associated helicase Cas3' [Candidatus Polarisedimenticolaceae bacterium]